MRGKEERVLIYRLAVGITPACAGKSVTGKGVDFDGKDHPRVCGEKVGQSGDVLEAVGSPPRVRGKAFFMLAIDR